MVTSQPAYLGEIVKKEEKRKKANMWVKSY